MTTSTQSQETLDANEWLADPCEHGCHSGVWARQDVGFTEECLDGPCVVCQGTGKRHAWAWERCVNQLLDPGHGDNCLLCQGSGWTLAVTLEKGLDALTAAGADWQLYPAMGGKGIHIGYDTIVRPTYLAAVLDALRQVYAN